MFEGWCKDGATRRCFSSCLFYAASAQPGCPAIPSKPLPQFLGFVEVVRREGPREQAFLQAGNPQGSDTLSTLVEGVRFVLCASQSGLEVRRGAAFCVCVCVCVCV